MLRTLTIPPSFKPGSTIGWISPSAGLAPFAMHRIKNARNFFESKGYKIKIAKHALENKGHVSASIANRVSDIHTLWQDPKVSVIMATIGGENSNQLLNSIDYDLIRRYPKIFVGYSDNTTLHFAFASQANLATYYGPCVMTQFGENPTVFPYTWKGFLLAVCAQKSEYDDTRVNTDYMHEILPSDTWTDEFINWFDKKDLERPRQLTPNLGYEWLRKGRAKGTAWGGAVPSINHLVGTEYWIHPNDSIFFIDIPEGHKLGSGLPPHEVDSFLTDLENIGVFKAITGMVVGRPPNYSKEEILMLREVLLRVTKKQKCPILLNVNMGHTDPIITLRYGAMIELDSAKNLFRAAK